MTRRAGVRRVTTALAIVAALAVVARAPTPAAADDSEKVLHEAEYEPYSQAWNGMASFIGLAEGMGFEVKAVNALEWSEIGADDILFLVFPLVRVDPAKLGAFVRAGGHVVIADDFGEGRDAMTGMGLLRAELGTPRTSRFYDGRPYAPIATARGDHPLARQVGDVVTNHPAVFNAVQGADVVVAFDDDSAIAVAGERGFGKFVAISDPSIFINRMMQFPGNVALTSNILDWLDRGDRRARNVVLLRGNTNMFGEPRPFIDDAHASELSRGVAALNQWLSTAESWLLTPIAMKVLAGALAFVLLVLALVALPVRRGPSIDGAWLRFGRPARRDEPHGLVAAAESSTGSNLVLACVLRDRVQRLLTELTGRAEPLYTVPESQLVAELSRAHGTPAAVALTRVYRRLRALPSRGQAAAPWSAGHLPRREFDALYEDAAELCRSLGTTLSGAPLVARHARDL